MFQQQICKQCEVDVCWQNETCCGHCLGKRAKPGQCKAINATGRYAGLFCKSKLFNDGLCESHCIGTGLHHAITTEKTGYGDGSDEDYSALDSYHSSDSEFIAPEKNGEKYVGGSRFATNEFMKNCFQDSGDSDEESSQDPADASGDSDDDMRPPNKNDSDEENSQESADVSGDFDEESFNSNDDSGFCSDEDSFCSSVSSLDEKESVSRKRRLYDSNSDSDLESDVENAESDVTNIAAADENKVAGVKGRKSVNGCYLTPSSVSPAKRNRREKFDEDYPEEANEVERRREEQQSLSNLLNTVKKKMAELTRRWTLFHRRDASCRRSARIRSAKVKEAAGKEICPSFQKFTVSELLKHVYDGIDEITRRSGESRAAATETPVSVSADKSQTKRYSLRNKRRDVPKRMILDDSESDEFSDESSEEESEYEDDSSYVHE